MKLETVKTIMDCVLMLSILALFLVVVTGVMKCQRVLESAVMSEKFKEENK